VVDPPRLAKAELSELDASLQNVVRETPPVVVQFNPENLKLTFSNQVQQPQAGGATTGQQSRQFVGTGTTRLALQLWFDVTAPPYSDEGMTDVRELTAKVTYFIDPKPPRGGGGGGAGNQTQLVPPGVRFGWGTFQFDGVLDSLDESLEYFSADGKPLRASMSLTLSQQKIFNPVVAGARRPGGAGTRPLTAAAAGATLQGLVGDGAAGSWQAVAAANGIEDPLRLRPGQLGDLGARR
jgi:hypothetical protein